MDKLLLKQIACLLRSVFVQSKMLTSYIRNKNINTDVRGFILSHEGAVAFMVANQIFVGEIKSF